MGDGDATRVFTYFILCSNVLGETWGMGDIYTYMLMRMYTYLYLLLYMHMLSSLSYVHTNLSSSVPVNFYGYYVVRAYFKLDLIGQPANQV